jgi:DHA2 family multidrug resistance protein
MVVSVAGFTLASLACGMAGNLEELVAFRLVQGACGASLVPLSQAVMLDINPPERQGPAMALYGMGSILGPVVGPLLGGWITDTFNWRWIFLINLPVGVLGFFLLSTFLDDRQSRQVSRFDAMGFVLLSVFIASLQIMLDRGQQLDWFDSPEIRIEATVAGLFGFLAAVHMLTANDPFIKPKIFLDRNFAAGSVITIAHGMLIFAVLALMAPMLQTLLAYPVMLSGMVTAPRGLATMFAMFFVGQIIDRVDIRYIIATGMLIAASSLYLMAHFPLDVDSWTIVWTGMLQGFGGGMVFVPLSVVMFSTLPASLRNECSALISLVRNMAAAISISYLQALTIRNTAAVHSRLVEAIRPDNPIVGMRTPDADFSSPAWAAATDLQVLRQATMVAYADSYWFLAIALLIATPLCFALRPVKHPAK